MKRARRSHPPTLLTLVERTLSDECRIEQGTLLLVAVSGGGDSQALLHALARLAPKLGLRLAAHGVDHGLRPEAPSELALARELATKLKVPFSESALELEHGGNLMARAREARYRALRRHAAEIGAALIATAHHADDRAETVLERLLRGAGPRGLAVLPARRDDLCRPLIRARRADIDAHLDRHALAFARDPSNQDRRFLRVRLRHEVLPLLEELSPGVVDHLNALADQLAREAPPELRDGEGRPISLGRAQLDQLRRLMEKKSPRGSVRLAGGRRITLDPRSGRPVVRQGAAKPRKSD
jgi:tRNA(Ile)-lysidine synthase